MNAPLPEAAISVAPQGSAAWHKKRAGKITGSRMHTVMGGGPKAWNTLMEKLDEEMLMSGEELLARAGKVYSRDMERGKRLESVAIAHYELINDVDVERPDFVVHPKYPFIGVSPDGFISRMRRAVEVKCPNMNNHMAYRAYGLPPKYTAQVNAEIWVLDADSCHFISYNPDVPDPNMQQYVELVRRSQQYIERMELKCLEFWDLYTSGKHRLKAEDININNLPKLF